jgi:hypothetical protein
MAGPQKWLLATLRARNRLPVDGALSFADLLFQPLDFLAQAGNAASDGYLVCEEDSPYGDPSGKQEMEIFHIESFAEDVTKAD